MFDVNTKELETVDGGGPAGCVRGGAIGAAIGALFGPGGLIAGAIIGCGIGSALEER